MKPSTSCLTIKGTTPTVANNSLGGSSLGLTSPNWTLLDTGLMTNNPFLWEDFLTSTQRFYRCSTP
jgi:hypothetical protein